MPHRASSAFTVDHQEITPEHEFRLDHEL